MDVTVQLYARRGVGDKLATDVVGAMLSTSFVAHQLRADVWIGIRAEAHAGDVDSLGIVERRLFVGRQRGGAPLWLRRGGCGRRSLYSSSWLNVPRNRCAAERNWCSIVDQGGGHQLQPLLRFLRSELLVFHTNHAPRKHQRLCRALQRRCVDRRRLRRERAQRRHPRPHAAEEFARSNVAPRQKLLAASHHKLDCSHQVAPAAR